MQRPWAKSGMQASADSPARENLRKNSELRVSHFELATRLTLELVRATKNSPPL